MKTRVVNVHKEPCDICIMRPSIYGNPFIIGRDGTREEVIAKFRIYFRKRIHNDMIYLTAIGELRGKKIGCCCAPKLCHGDIYVEFFPWNDWACTSVIPAIYIYTPDALGVYCDERVQPGSLSRKRHTNRFLKPYAIAFGHIAHLGAM